MAEAIAATLLRGFRDRLVRLLTDRAEIDADIHELKLEVKMAGLNPTELSKWAQAEVKDKTQKRIDALVDAALYGEALGHETGLTSETGIVRNRARDSAPFVENDSREAA